MQFSSLVPAEPLWQCFVQQGIAAAASAIGVQSSSTCLLFAQWCWQQEGLRSTELVLLQLLALLRTYPVPQAEPILRQHILAFYGTARKYEWRAQLAAHLHVAASHSFFSQLLIAMTRLHVSVLEELVGRFWMRHRLDFTLDVLNCFQGVPYRLVRRVASKLNKAALMQAGHRPMLPGQVEGVPVPTPIVEEDSLSGVAQAIATLVAEEQQNGNGKRAAASLAAQALLNVAAGVTPASTTTGRSSAKRPMKHRLRVAGSGQVEMEADAASNSPAPMNQGEDEQKEEEPAEEIRAAAKRTRWESSTTPNSIHSPSTPALVVQRGSGEVDVGSSHLASTSQELESISPVVASSAAAAAAAVPLSGYDEQHSLLNASGGELPTSSAPTVYPSSVSARSLSAVAQENPLAAAAVIAPLATAEVFVTSAPAAAAATAVTAGTHSLGPSAMVASESAASASVAAAAMRVADLECRLHATMQELEQLKEAHACQLRAADKQRCEEVTQQEQLHGAHARTLQRMHELLHTLEFAEEDYCERAKSDAAAAEPDQVERLLTKLLECQAQLPYSYVNDSLRTDLKEEWVHDRETLEAVLSRSIREGCAIDEQVARQVIGLLETWLHRLQQGSAQRVEQVLLTKRVACVLQLLPRKPSQDDTTRPALLELHALKARLLVHMWPILLRMPCRELFDRTRDKLIRRVRDWYADAAQAAAGRGERLEQMRLLVEQCTFLQEHDCLCLAKHLKHDGWSDYLSLPLECLQRLLSNYPAASAELQQDVASASVTLSDLLQWDADERTYASQQERLAMLQQDPDLIDVGELDAAQALLNETEAAGAHRQFTAHRLKCELLFHPDKRRRRLLHDTTSQQDMNHQFQQMQEAWAALTSFRALAAKLRRFMKEIEEAVDL